MFAERRLSDHGFVETKYHENPVKNPEVIDLSELMGYEYSIRSKVYHGTVLGK
jgi:hypothetical protein